MKIKDIIIIVAGTVIVLALLLVKHAPQEARKVAAQAKPAVRQRQMPVVGVVQGQDKEIKFLLEKLDSPDYQESRQAAEKIFALGREATPELIAALPKASAGQKGQIIFLLGRIADKSAQEALFEASREPNSYIRRNAVEALGKIKSPQAIPVLSVGLSDEDAGVRERAAWALGETGRREAGGYLAGCLKEEKEERVRLTAVAALGKIKDDSATGLLLGELESKANTYYKDSVVKALGEIGDRRSLPALEEYLRNLEQNKPREEILLSGWQRSIAEAKEAISKIGNK